MRKNYFFDDKVEFVIQLMTPSSGSYLYQSIVDGHNEVVCIPTHVDFYNIEKRMDNISSNKNKLMHFIDFYIEETLYELYFKVKTTYMGDFSNFEFNWDKFKEILKSLLLEVDKLSIRIFIEALHYAWAKALGQDLTKTKIIYIHSHGRTCYDNHIISFPDAKYICTIRHPVPAMHSTTHIKRRNLEGFEYFSLEHFYWSILGISKIYKIKNILSRDKFKFFRLEDLHTKTKETILDFIKYLGVSELPSIFESTLGGKKYISNSSINNSISGFGWGGGNFKLEV